TREVTHKTSGKIEQGCRYFATSLRPHEAGPERLSHQIRGYWGVENIVHWRRDVLCREDKCRLRNANAACILALLRTALITLVRCSGYDSLKVAHEMFAHDPNTAIQCLLMKGGSNPRFRSIFLLRAAERHHLPASAARRRSPHRCESG